MAIHYLDNASTTRVSEAAALEALRVMREDFGNPSSLHSLGIKALDLLEEARGMLAGLVSFESEVIFTSGGTEADNLALRGAVRAMKRRGNHVVTTAVEHPAVLNTLKALEAGGEIALDIVPVDRDGRVDLERFSSCLRPDTVLVSMMLVNNETGVVQPVRQAVSMAKSANPECVFHTDAVQGLGKIPVDCGADLIALSGHKIHAPKGIGALIKRKGLKLFAQQTGGGQQYGLREGTEMMPAIAALSRAVGDAVSDMDENNRKIGELFALMRDGIGIAASSARVMTGGLPHITTISLPGVPSEVLMRMLEEDSVYVSSGSACSRGKRSHVLAAMGLEPGIIDSSVRVSLSGDNCREDIEALLSSLAKAAKRMGV